MLTMTTFLFHYEVASAFDPGLCHIDPLKALQLDQFKTHFICVCGSISNSTQSLRGHIGTTHQKLFDLLKSIPAAVTRILSNKEITAVEELFKNREELCHESQGKSLIGSIEEQVIRVVGLISFFKIVPKNYAQP